MFVCEYVEINERGREGGGKLGKRNKGMGGAGEGGKKAGRGREREREKREKEKEKGRRREGGTEGERGEERE